MIPFASQRGGGQDLATHLLNSYDNEIVEVHALRGSLAADLHGAFHEWQVQAETLTRCDKYLYSLSVNPDPTQGPLSRDQYMDYIARVEDALGLKDQPRAVVFHNKYGREHCHVIWSRIDAEHQKAVHLAFDRDKLMRVTRGFARDHNLALPAGYEKSRGVGQISLYEQEQRRQTGLSKEDHMRAVTEAWRQSDDARAFVQALSERGYILATGKRPYVLVDLYGNSNSLPKLIEDKSVRTTDIRAFLEKDFPPESLPSVDEAEMLVAKHRKLIESSQSANAAAPQLAALKHQQQERRAQLEQAVSQAAQHHINERAQLNFEHRAQAEQRRAAYREQTRLLQVRRREGAGRGLAAFLGRVTGVTQLRKVLHRRQDAKRLDVYRDERRELKSVQAKEHILLEQRCAAALQDLERQNKALGRVERRELAAVLRDHKAELRTREREGGFVMPPLRDLLKADQPRPTKRFDLLAAFERAKNRTPGPPPDLTGAFGRAARDTPPRDQDSDGREARKGVEPSTDKTRPDGRER